MTVLAGALAIKYEAVSGKASASFVDSNKFKDSDINYLIQVKVVNQHHKPADLTKFSPIGNKSTEALSEAAFTRVYGDSFISGFTEGGEFNALVSIKLKEKSKKKEISGQLQIGLDLKALSVSGSAKGGFVKDNANIDGETTISVSWRGGGKIEDTMVKAMKKKKKPEGEKPKEEEKLKVEDPLAKDGSDGWTLQTLKEVAMAFPEHVRKCPSYTKYASPSLIKFLQMTDIIAQLSPSTQA